MHVHTYTTRRRRPCQDDIVRIIRITGDDSIRTHLAELGFAVGAEVKVVKAVKGNLILQVHGTRLALDQSMASRLLVEF